MSASVRKVHAEPPNLILAIGALMDGFYRCEADSFKESAHIVWKAMTDEPANPYPRELPENKSWESGIVMKYTDDTIDTHDIPSAFSMTSVRSSGAMKKDGAAHSSRKKQQQSSPDTSSSSNRVRRSLKIAVYGENPKKYVYDPPQTPAARFVATEKEASSSSHNEKTLKLEARDDVAASPPPSAPIRKTKPSSRSRLIKSGRAFSSRPKGQLPQPQGIQDLSGIAFCRSRLDIDAKSLHTVKSKDRRLVRPMKLKKAKSAVFSSDSIKEKSNRRNDRLPAALKRASSKWERRTGSFPRDEEGAPMYSRLSL
jgi:hypothetical protein